MFLKPYRTLIAKDAEDSQQAWFQQDMKAAPLHIISSLNEHLKTIQSNNIEYHLTPVRINGVTGKKPSDVSFKYSGCDNFILRDLAFGTTITNSLLNFYTDMDIDQYIQLFFKRMINIDYFLKGINNPDFNRVRYHGESRYHQSFIIGLQEDAKSIYDIEYIEIFLDDLHDIIPTNVKMSLCPEVIQRVGISFKVYMNPINASFEKIKETINCSNICCDGSRYNTINETSRHMATTFDVNSVEYCFQHQVNDINNAFVSYLSANKDLLVKRLGYNIDSVDINTLNLVDMIIV